MAFQNVKFNEICRVCLQDKTDMGYIFDNVIPTTIMSFTNVQMFEGDGLPTLICQDCCKEVNNINKFKMLCQQSDSTLRFLLKNFLLEIDDFYTEVFEVKAELLEDEDCTVESLLDFQSSIEVHEQDDREPINETSTGETDLISASNSKENKNQSEKTIEKTVKEQRKVKKKVPKNNTNGGEIISKSSSVSKLPKPQFICNICTKVYSTRENLKKHELVHTGLKPFLCEECGKSFARKEDLSVHARYHTGVRPYSCRWCNRTFVIQSGLKSHETRHTGLKPFLCNWCGKTFTTRNQLQIHERQHTNERPWSCSLCGGKFTSRQAWTNHMKRHKGIEYICDICQRPFFTTSGLDRHKLLHAGNKAYPCDYCDMSFYTKSEVTRHLRYHKNERLYKCKQCTKSFMEKQHLVIHERIHSGERPYACKLCNKAFYARSKLSRHMFVHKPKTSEEQDVEEMIINQDDEHEETYVFVDDVLEENDENQEQVGLSLTVGEHVEL